jgi:magnesium-protoporphyrin IX monomethyl ester (oxidative) cyclase
MRTKVMLLQSISPVVNPAPPLGLGYIAAVLERVGCKVRIIDGSAPYAYYSLQDLVDEVKSFSPDLVGLSIFITFSRYSYQLMKLLSQQVGVPIVVGGPQPTLLPEEALNNHADIVVRGDGEETVAELMDYLEGKIGLSGILGISYKNSQGEIVHNPPRSRIQDLDTIPFPAKHAFIREHYAKSGSEINKFGNILTSRGCPYRCTYCATKLLGRKVRFRSPENVIAEIESLMVDYGVTKFAFLDDAVTISKKHLQGICQLIIDRGLSISWICNSRLDTVSRESLEMMKEAGCKAIDFGIESGNPETLRKIRKGTTPERAIEVLRWTKELGIESMANFMYGFPWETPEEMRITTDYIRNEILPLADAIMPAGILIPFPATEIYEEYKDVYQFENWWLKDETEDEAQLRVSQPLFERIFFSYYTLEDDFFNYSPEVVREIEYAAKIVGRHNLLKYCKRLLSNKLAQLFLREVLYLLVLVSRALHEFNPKLERVAMKPILALASRYQLQESKGG